ncbi:MAG: glycosyltransferase family 2 protein [Bacilli bacterium]|nr:glycosyltransferase family 2 protein [Bacilli bacterium]
MKKNDVLYVVVPCYNEEEVLEETNKRLVEKLKDLINKSSISKNSRIMYVNDGSKDKTWELIEKLHKSNELVCGLKLSRNRGHQNALFAGLMTAKDKADMIISMDADLQDDINAVDEMIEKYYNGCEVVYGVRSSRKKDTFFKKFTAEGFYKIMKFMGVDIVFNHADYRLTSKRVLSELSNYKEVNLFLRGLFPVIGFKSDVVYYERAERFAGESKYPLKKMVSFAWEGITSFTVKPLKMIMNLGLIIALFSFIFLIYVIIGYFTGNSVSGWTTIIVLLCLFSGIQIFCIGIIGEYLGKVYIETKERPRYIIAQALIHEGKE